MIVHLRSELTLDSEIRCTGCNKKSKVRELTEKKGFLVPVLDGSGNEYRQVLYLCSCEAKPVLVCDTSGLEHLVLQASAILHADDAECLVNAGGTK